MPGGDDNFETSYNSLTQIVRISSGTGGGTGGSNLAEPLYAEDYVREYGSWWEKEDMMELLK